MRKLVGVVVLALGICGIVVETRSSYAQVLPNQYCNSVGVACGACTDENGGCWAWRYGEGWYSCTPEPGAPGCDPAKRNVYCKAYWYWPSSCTAGFGLTCYEPNTCCESNGKQMDDKDYNHDSCK
jgi:hypothetical protein